MTIYGGTLEDGWVKRDVTVTIVFMTTHLVQCRHFIPALNAWATGHNTRPIATKLPGHEWMDDLTT